jgi:hypothetical protein
MRRPLNVKLRTSTVLLFNFFGQVSPKPNPKPRAEKTSFNNLVELQNKCHDMHGWGVNIWG